MDTSRAWMSNGAFKTYTDKETDIDIPQIKKVFRLLYIMRPHINSKRNRSQGGRIQYQKMLGQCRRLCGRH